MHIACEICHETYYSGNENEIAKYDNFGDIVEGEQYDHGSWVCSDCVPVFLEQLDN